MERRNYNSAEANSILSYAKQLIDKSLKEWCPLDEEQSLNNRGTFGLLLERYFFGIDNNSRPEADFPRAGVELKASPLKQNQSGVYVSKERVVLGIINYETIVDEVFEYSHFLSKNACLLFVFYLYEEGVLPWNYIVKLVDLWRYSGTDYDIIKRDWEFIQDKVRRGLAHELSEGDTFYLGACTKGANARSLRKQPYSQELAMQRAFSLKQGYVNHIIATIAQGSTESYGRLLTGTAQNRTIEQVLSERLSAYQGHRVEDIARNLTIDLDVRDKARYARLAKRMLGMQIEEEIEEFKKAEIELKAIRITSQGRPAEDISFPVFQYTQIVTEDWEESDLKDIIEHKFLFVFYKHQEDGGLIFEKFRLWNMPYEDRQQVQQVWEDTKLLVSEGRIVSSISAGGRRNTNFPKSSEGRVAHVRPHARNASDTFPLPCPDLESGATTYTKHCFWLNSSYVRDRVYNHD